VKTNLYGLTLEALRSLVAKLNKPRYRSDQLSHWLYHRHASTIDEMTNLSLSDRADFAGIAEIRVNEPHQQQISTDQTRKYTFVTESQDLIESALIPDNDRNTLCVSSQVGCRVGCKFCATGAMRLRGNLSAGEILNQYRSIPEREQITNIVFMGMGEPLDNLNAVVDAIEILTSPYGYAMSNRRLTLSTVGKPEPLRRFLDRCDVRLAVSLHTPFEEQRRQLLPGTRGYDLRELLTMLRDRARDDSRRVSFEYVMLKGVNDSMEHADATARLLAGMNTRINLIPFHPWEGNDLEPAEPATIARFRARLEERGLIATTRVTRGLDIDAACGLLATRRPTISGSAPGAELRKLSVVPHVLEN
jgi:23S rRNA (adenine2503-C2)-methyltransferase